MPEWLISAKATYDNYMKPGKRRNFPDFADFYDDLKAHYDCYEFNSDHPDRDKVIRIWDLRKRVRRATVHRVGRSGR